MDLISEVTCKLPCGDIAKLECANRMLRDALRFPAVSRRSAACEVLQRHGLTGASMQPARFASQVPHIWGKVDLGMGNYCSDDRSRLRKSVDNLRDLDWLLQRSVQCHCVRCTPAAVHCVRTLMSRTQVSAR